MLLQQWVLQVIQQDHIYILKLELMGSVLILKIMFIREEFRMWTLFWKVTEWIYKKSRNGNMKYKFHYIRIYFDFLLILFWTQKNMVWFLFTHHIIHHHIISILFLFPCYFLHFLFTPSYIISQTYRGQCYYWM